MNSSNSEKNERIKNMILGALVADAATMGFHWLYSQRRIVELAPENPEFRTPDENDYSGNVGYFAHGHKHAGELSHYGEQALVMLDSLADNHGVYDKAHYQEQFRKHFGYGGQFVGYIDRPTRETLDNIYRNENEQLARAKAIPFSGDEKVKQGLLVKILAASKRYTGDRLLQEAKSFAAATETPEDYQKFITALVTALEGASDYPGAIDEQLPAVSKLPALVAVYAEDKNLDELVASAVKVTNNAPRALDYAKVCQYLLQGVMVGHSMQDAIVNAVSVASPQSRPQFEQALQSDKSVSELTRQYGLNCDLGCGVTSLIYNLHKASSFKESVTQNIYAGGDNCGRSIVLGAALGAVYGRGGEKGIPEDWILNLEGSRQLMYKIDRLIHQANIDNSPDEVSA